jgi:hypothetical protein
VFLITLTMQSLVNLSGYGRYITPDGITALKNHKYKPGHYTPMDNAMQPFWNCFVSLVPLVSQSGLFQKKKPVFIIDWLLTDYVLFSG